MMQTLETFLGMGSSASEQARDVALSAVKEADFTEIQALGFDPKVNLEEGINRTYTWMLNNDVL